MGQEEEALLLNIAERDLAEVADAIAAAAGPVHDAELAALLAEVAAGLPAPTAAQLAGDSPAVAAAAAAVGLSAAAAAAAAPDSQEGFAPAELRSQARDDTSDPTAHSPQQQQQQQQPGDLAGVGHTLEAAGGAAGPDLDGSAAAGTSFRLPQTLPAARSWMDTGVAAAAAGLVAPVQSGEHQRALALL